MASHGDLSVPVPPLGSFSLAASVHLRRWPHQESLFEGLRGANVVLRRTLRGSNGTRGFVFISREFLRMQEALGGLALARGDFFPGFRARLFAIPRNASGSPENRDLGAALPGGPASSAESCRAVLRDAEEALLLQFLERNLGVVVIHGFPPAGKSLHCIVLSYRHEGESPKKGKGRRETVLRSKLPWQA